MPLWIWAVIVGIGYWLYSSKPPGTIDANNNTSTPPQTDAQKPVTMSDIVDLAKGASDAVKKIVGGSDKAAQSEKQKDINKNVKPTEPERDDTPMPGAQNNPDVE